MTEELEMEEFSVDADKKSFRTILKGHFYKIPRYQRPYSWGEEELQEYWDDIRTSTGEGHFMGNFVAHGLQDRVLEIVDGQQRLTTTLILLCRVRDILARMGEESKVKGIDQYVLSIDDDGEPKWRLTPTDPSSYIASNIFPNMGEKDGAAEAATDGDRAVKRAARLLDQFIDHELSERCVSDVDRVQVLSEIRDWALSANLVHIRLADRKAAFDIFETLNDRGKSLTQADLVKTLIVSILTPKSPMDAVVSRWDRISSIVSSSTLSEVKEFLRHHWNSVSMGDGEKIVVERALRKHISRYLEEEGEGQFERAQFYVDSLEDTSRFLEIIDAPLDKGSWIRLSESDLLDFEYHPDKVADIGARLFYISQWGNTQAMPLLFCLMRKFVPRISNKGDWRIKTSLVKEYLDIIDVLEFRWKMSSSGSTSTHRDLYRKASLQLDRAASGEEARLALEVFLDSVRKILPSDARVREGMKKVSYIGQSRTNSNVVRIILSRVNESWGGEGFRLDTPDRSIEHIKGQRGVSVGANRNLWVGRLGNLMLLPSGINSRLPEEPAEKIPDIREHCPTGDSSLREFLADKKWGAAQASRRLNNIAEAATSKVWSLPE